MKPGKTPQAQAQAQAQPVVKRPRGRPRKLRNNTVDTAILLSDSDREDGDAADKQVPQKDKKRPWTKVESPAQSPALKRPVSSRASAVPPPAAASAAQAELDRLLQHLESEKTMRADAEAVKADLQKRLEEKDASWVAEMAAQTTPLQLQLQRIAKEKRDSDAVCKILEARLQEALDKEQDHQASLIEPQPAAPNNNKEEVEVRIREKDALISNQAAEVERLKGVEVARTKELAGANQKATALTETLKALTVRHGAATKMIQEHETRIQHLTHALSKSMNFPATAGEARTAVTNTLAQANMRIAQAEHQIKDAREKVADLQRKLVASTEERVTLEKKLTETEGKLGETEVQLAQAKKPVVTVTEAVGAAKGQAPGPEQTAPSQAQVIIHNLRHGQSIMVEERKASLLEIKHLQDTVAGLEKEKLQWTAANHENSPLLQQLGEQKAQVSALQRCKKEWEEASTVGAREMASLRQRLEGNTKEIDALQRERARLTGVLAATRNELMLIGGNQEAQAKTMATVQQERDDLVRKHQSVVDQHAALRAEISQAGPSLAAKNEEVRALKDKMEKGKVAFTADIQALVVKLRDKVQQLALRDSDARGLQRTVDVLRLDVARQESETNTVKEQLLQRNARIVHNDQTIAEQQTQIQDLQKAVSTLSAEKTKLNDDLAAETDNLHQSERRLTQLTADNENLKISTSTRAQETEILRKELSIVKVENDNLKKEVATGAAEIHTLKAQLASPSDTTTTLTEQPSCTPASKDDEETDTPHPTVTDLLAAKTLSDQTITALQTEVQHLTTQLSNATTTPTDVEDLQARITQLAEANSSLEKDRQEQAAEADTLRSRLAEVKDETEALEEDLRKRDGCLERMRGFVNSLPKWMESTMGKPGAGGSS